MTKSKIIPTLLSHKYAHEIHCNEVRLLPYYIASMNIEHEYHESTNTYKSFKKKATSDGMLFYARTDEFWKKEEKLNFLEKAQSLSGVKWRLLTPDKNHTWLTEQLRVDFEGFLPLVDKLEKKEENHLLPEFCTMIVATTACD